MLSRVGAEQGEADCGEAGFADLARAPGRGWPCPGASLTIERPDAEKVRDIRLDLTARVEFFDLLGDAARNRVLKKRRAWAWEAPKTPELLKDRFLAHFEALQREETERVELYEHLMQLLKFQLFYLAFTFV